MIKQIRNLVYIIFIFTCFEGLLVNIFYPSKLPYIAKDVLILTTYVLLLLIYKNRFLLPTSLMSSLLLPLFLFSIIPILYLLLPGIGMIGKLVAIKQRLFYIPLLSVAYFCIRSDEDLDKLFQIITVTAVFASLYGIRQHFLGPDSLREIGANYSAEIYTPSWNTGSDVYWRVPGTFTSPGQYGAYLQFSGLMVIAFLVNQKSKKWKVICSFSIVVILLALLVSGSRAPIVLLTLSLAMLLWMSRKLSRVVSYGLVGYVLLAYGYSFLGPGVKDRFASIASIEHIQRFQSSYFGQMFLPSLVDSPMGSGLGMATIGARHFSELKDVILVESYLGILTVETGILGLFTAIFLCGVLIRVVFRLNRYIKNSESAILGYAFSVYVIFTVLILPVSTCIDSAPSNLYFWFSVGAVLKIADLSRQDKQNLKVLPVSAKIRQPAFEGG